ncbi:MAG: NB-ARC domain-containing protein [Chloroflexota bacterium]
MSSQNVSDLKENTPEYISIEEVDQFLEQLRDQKFGDVTPFKKLVTLGAVLTHSETANDVDLSIACKQLLQNANEKLTILIPNFGRLLFKRYFKLERETDRQIYTALKITEGKYYRHIKQARERLTNIINQEEDRARAQARLKLALNIGGSTAINYVGESDAYRSYLSKLKDPSAEHIIVLTGMGGIGKTTMAERGLQETINELPISILHRVDIPNGIFRRSLIFDSLYEQMGGAAKDGVDPRVLVVDTLKRADGLVFIDGMEFDLQGLIDLIQSLNLPNIRFVITSREEPSVTDWQIAHIRLTELTKEEAKALLRDDAEMIKEQYGIEPFSEAQSVQIIEAVGGHPLALKLVAGLLTELTPVEVINDLKQLIHPDTHEMYTRVYMRVWRALSESSQSVLIALAAIEGIRLSRSNLRWMLDQLEYNLNERDVVAATNELRSRSLIEIRPGGDKDDSETTYGLHNLTRHFMTHDIYESLG